MPQLPVLSGRETVRNFERFGWSVARQRASHIILTNREKWRLSRYQIIERWPKVLCAALSAKPA